MANEAEAKVASSVVTSDNAATFYAERLGLADNNEPPEAEGVKESSEPAQVEGQSEPEAEEEAKEALEAEKPKDKLNKRFEKVSKRAQEAEAKAAELENRLKELEGRVNPQQQQEQKPVIADGEPQAQDFTDPFDYARELARWSAENALKQREQQEAIRKSQESWEKKLEKAKAEYDDWDDVVPSSKVPVRPEIRYSILESDVGPQILYALASDEDFARKLSEMPVIKALKELGKLEAKFEVPQKTTTVSNIVSRSKAPEPIRPLSSGRAGADVLVDTNGEFLGTPAQYREARRSGKLR